jgi:UV DNA damage endonuclease
MVLDIHHHWVRNEWGSLAEESMAALQDVLPDIFGTWKDRLPKIHVSSPKSFDTPKAHADYVEPERYIAFAENALKIGAFDVMIEAKCKDKALLQLFKDIGAHQSLLPAITV